MGGGEGVVQGVGPFSVGKLEPPYPYSCKQTALSTPSAIMSERESQPERLFKVLSIDGGGTKGLYSAKIIEEIEREYSSAVCDHFDLICGTSTGGLIALALSLRIPASRIVEFYQTHSGMIFPSRNIIESLSRLASQVFVKSKYGNQELAKALTCLFGERKLGESETLLCIPSFSLSDGRPFIFKHDHKEGRLSRDNNTSYLDVALATSAAPTYLPVVSIPNYENRQFIDGGIYANDPSLVGVIEAFRYFVGEGKPFRKLGVLSIASLETVPGRKRVKFTNRSIVQWKDDLLSTFFESQAHMTSYVVSVMANHCDPGFEYVRIPSSALDAARSKLIGLDCSSQESLDTLVSMAKDMYYKYRGNERIKSFFQETKLYCMEA
jgi:hypothetical protein